MQNNLTTETPDAPCKCPALALAKRNGEHLTFCPQAKKPEQDFIARKPAPKGPRLELRLELQQTPRTCSKCGSDLTNGECHSCPKPGAYKPTADAFNNSTQLTAFCEVADYFRKSAGTAALCTAVGRASLTRKSLTAAQLEKIANSHRFGGMLHSIKRRFLVSWNITRKNGDTVYTFFPTAKPPQTDGGDAA